MRTAYLFPGQGSQHVGMGRELYDREPAARAVFVQADEFLGFPLSELCFSGPEELLTDTANQQPALFVTSLAAWTVTRRNGWPNPTYVAGHSLGQFSALAAVGALSFADGLGLVRKRGLLMKLAGEAEPGAMAAILGLTLGQVQRLCAQAQDETNRPIQVANNNCPGQVVISGDQTALNRAVELAEISGARRIVTLPISIAAHSPLMASAAAEFAEVVETISIHKAAVPVIANTSAKPLSSPNEIRSELIAQLTGSVLWMESMQFLRSQEVDTFIEVGPGSVLSSLMKRIDRSATRKVFELGE